MLGSLGEKESYQEASDRVTKELTAIVDAFHGWMTGGGKAEQANGGFLSLLHPRRLFTYFPLQTFPPSQIISPTPQRRLQKPTLYVEQAHPGKLNWASRDPRNLYWQMMLAFQDVDFDCVYVGGYDDPNNVMGQTPFLQNANTVLVETKDLSVWLQHVAPIGRESDAGAQEKGVESLLEGPLMAGVVSEGGRCRIYPYCSRNSFFSQLLELLNLPTPASPSSRPILSKMLQDSLLVDEKRRLAGHVSTLTDSSPLSRIPGWTTSLHGLFGSSGVMTNVGAGQEEQEDDAEASIDVSSLNQTQILADAIDAIQAVSFLLEDSSKRWLGGDE